MTPQQFQNLVVLVVEVLPAGPDGETGAAPVSPFGHAGARRHGGRFGPVDRFDDLVGPLDDVERVEADPDLRDLLAGDGQVDAVTIASTASQEQRSSRAMLALSMRCASQAATFSKSAVCRAFGRAHGTCSVRTRPQERQSTRWMSASSLTWQAPKSRCRHRRRDVS
nr:hypothetical protein [Actinoplanes sp. OR16]